MADEVPANSGEQDTSEIDVLNEDTSTGEVTSEETTEETTEEEEAEEAPTEEEEEEEEEETEEEEDEDEDEGEDGETEEISRPSWQLIKEKYPELTKDKDFRAMYFRDKAYTEIYPTLNDAREAANKADQLDALDSTLMEGNVEAVFGTLNPDVLSRISDKLLPALYKRDQNAFAKAARPLVVNVLRTVLNRAEETGDDNLKKSVRNITRVLTGGNPDLPTVDTRTDPSIEAERNRLTQERRALFDRDNRGFIASCDKTVNRRLESIIMDDLDSKKQLNEFTRQSVAERTLSDLHAELMKDEGLRNKLQQIHRLAAKAGFPEEYRARIVSASLERAKKLVPVFRNKHFNAALGKQSTRVGNKEKIVTKNETVTSGGNSGSSRGKIDTRKTSAEDFLNDRNVSYRK